MVYESNSRQDFVLKRCGVQSPESLEIVKKEISILQTFGGPYIVKMFASEIQTIRGNREALILLEYCPGGHMLSRLNSFPGDFPESRILRIFGQILLGMKSLHLNNPPVTHRDLKLENILVGSDGNVRICDFGSCIFGDVFIGTPEARNAAEEIVAKQSTLIYRAPEMVDLYMRDVLTFKTDIWALGCIFYALCFRTHPFGEGSLAIVNGKYNIPSDSTISNDTKTVISRMLDVSAFRYQLMVSILNDI